MLILQPHRGLTELLRLAQSRFFGAIPVVRIPVVHIKVIVL